MRATQSGRPLVAQVRLERANDYVGQRLASFARLTDDGLPEVVVHANAVGRCRGLVRHLPNAGHRCEHTSTLGHWCNHGEQGTRLVPLAWARGLGGPLNQLDDVGGACAPEQNLAAKKHGRSPDGID